MLPPLTAVQQAASETVERDTLEWAESAIVAGDLASAEAVLMRLRSRDPHRDMPRRLHEAFLALFRAYAEAEPDKLWPLEGLSALHMDAEEWDLCLDTCSQAIDKHAPPGPQNLQEGAGRPSEASKGPAGGSCRAEPPRSPHGPPWHSSHP